MVTQIFLYLLDRARLAISDVSFVNNLILGDPAAYEEPTFPSLHSLIISQSSH